MNQLRNRTAGQRRAGRREPWQLGSLFMRIASPFIARESFKMYRFRGSCMREYDLI